jgi:hypothetical protein
VLTERDMCDQCEKEAAGGRVPPEIEFVCAILPSELNRKLIEARRTASSQSWARARDDVGDMGSK